MEEPPIEIISSKVEETPKPCMEVDIPPNDQIKTSDDLVTEQEKRSSVEDVVQKPRDIRQHTQSDVYKIYLDI